LLLENLRFYPGEEKNDLNFTKQLIKDSGAEVTSMKLLVLVIELMPA